MAAYFTPPCSLFPRQSGSQPRTCRGSHMACCWRGDTHTGAGSVASKQRGERESGSVCVRVVRRFHPPIVTAPATPATGTAARSKARFSFVWPVTRSRCLVSSWTVLDSLLMGGTKLFHLRSLVLLSEPEMEAAVRSRTPSRPLTLSARAWCKSRTCTQTLTLNLTLC